MEDKIEPGEGIVAYCKRMKINVHEYRQPTQKEWDDLWKHLEEKSRKPRTFTEYWNGAALKALNPERYKDCDDHCTYIITYTSGDYHY